MGGDPHELAAARRGFANEKQGEVNALACAANDGDRAAASTFQEGDRAQAEAGADRHLHDPRVPACLAAVAPELERRASPFPMRGVAQAARLDLPELPVTAVSSWPQNAELRRLRARLARG